MSTHDIDQPVKFLHRMDDDLSDTPDLGGKAAALAELAALTRSCHLTRNSGDAEIQVPDWFLITPQVFPTDSSATVTAELEQIIREQVDAATKEISPPSTALTETPDRTPLFAVRSSANDEDGGQHSFAGQFESFLAVPASQVWDRAVAVWQSGFSPRVQAYRDEHGLGQGQPPAVLVQQQIAPMWSGVAFSLDPVSGSWDQAVVAAVRGLGTVLVDGRVDASSWQVSRDGRVTSQARGQQDWMDQCMPAGGVSSQPFDSSTVAPPDPQLIAAVAQLARRCAALRGAPQDIEWAWDGHRLWLLQSRPITTIHRLVDKEAQPAIWDTSNIAESYGGITSPLTFSFASRVYQAVYREFCRLMGVPQRVIAANESVFAGLLGLINGRMNYNLLNWYRLLACFPGYQLNARFMEQMMGVREPLPPDIQAQMTAPRRGWWRKVKDLAQLGQTLMGLGWNHLTLSRQIRRFYGRLDNALALPAIPLAQQRPDELRHSYLALEDQLLLRWDAPLVNDFFAMIYYGLLKIVCEKWCGADNASLQNDLVGGDGTVVSAEPVKLMRAMADMLADQPEFAAVLRQGSCHQIEHGLQQLPLLASAVAAYLDRFADRCMEELKLESPTLRDDPMSLYRGIGHLALRQDAPDQDYAAIARQRAEQQARVAIGWHPIKRPLFAWLLRQARRRVRDRENLRFERTRLFGRVRQIFLEIGRRLSAAGVIAQARDIFYLEQDEVFSFMDGTISCPDLAGLITVRRQWLVQQSSQDATDRLMTYGWVHVGNDLQAKQQPVMSPSGVDQQQGLGCCPGVVRGRAVVVRDPSGVSLPAGSILVAERTDPGWIMLFPAAAGLVVERGSLLSHSAIVARELGLPCAVSVPSATIWLQTGDQIELDGATGIVRRISDD